MSTPFNQKRRQQFLTEAFYQAYKDGLVAWNLDLEMNLKRDELGLENIYLEAMRLAENTYRVFSLRYTAGESIESLRGELEKVILAYEKYQKALAAYEQIPKVVPLGFRQLADYERCMQLIGLCYLLHRRDLLPRIAALQDPGYEGEDALYEELLDYELDQRFDTDLMFHKKVYEPLLQSMYCETDEESIGEINNYVNHWYAHFKYVPWHDGHLRIIGTEGDYFGYWAFEAGAVAYLLGIEDDSSIKHMVYPRDMVEFARNFKAEESPDQSTRMKVHAGERCPQSGYWFTPAQINSRRYFNAGDVLPELGTDYGATIWEWDGMQPKNTSA